MANAAIMAPVERWRIALGMVLLACLPILLMRATSPALLGDSDTAEILRVIRMEQNPLQWFVGDWPLGNHFYRPISTLTFELDHALWGDQATGYGWTNAILAVLCVVSLFWFLREVTDRPGLSAGGAILFALWTLGWGHHLRPPVLLLTLAVLLLSYISLEVVGIAPLYFRMVAWLPGRTASVMTLFALLSLAAYARFERRGAERAAAPAPGALDLPATRSSVQVSSNQPASYIWLGVSMMGLILALGSYEQSVMLPAALLGTAICLRLQRIRVRWVPHAFFWALLGGYLVLRGILVPSEVSAYQEQQLRSGSTVLLSILEYLFPMASTLPFFWSGLQVGPLVLITAQPWEYLWHVAANVSAFVQLRTRWVLGVAGLGLSVVAFLPMAWLKPFEHYHYWPMAMRSLFVVVLAWIAMERIIAALSPPTLQAPQRPSPAPGSLLRR
jgi:hypothetical protein